MLVREEVIVRREHGCAGGRDRFLGTPFDSVGFQQAIDLLEATKADTTFRYVVTPNVDHVVRLEKTRQLAECYDAAWLSLCDSKPISMMAKVLSLEIPQVTGSDLTVALFDKVIGDTDKVAIIAANDTLVDDLKRTFPRMSLRTFVPPIGLLGDKDGMRRCVEFAAQGDEQFIFIAVGSPQSERIAFELSRHPKSHGVALCVGASLEFIVGAKKRAPSWMRNAGLEWLHRLSSEPRRLWRRYVYSVVPLMRLFANECWTRRLRTRSQ